MSWPAPLTVRELGAELDCTEEEVRGLTRDGELPGMRWRPAWWRRYRMPSSSIWDRRSGSVDPSIERQHADSGARACTPP